MSISFAILPLFGLGWVNSVSGATSGVMMGDALAGSGGGDRKPLGNSTMRARPAMWNNTEAAPATPERPRDAGAPHSGRKGGVTSSSGGPTVSIHQPRFWRQLRSAP